MDTTHIQEKMMKRSDQVHLMMDKTDSLAEEAGRIENPSKKVNHYKIAISVVALIVVIILVFLTIRWGSR